MSSRRPLLSKVCRLSAAIALLVAAPAAAQTAPPPAAPKVMISVNGGAQVSSHKFTQTSTLRVNQEDGSVEADYTSKGAPLFDVGGGVKLQDRLWVTVAFSSFSKKSGADVSARIPHPLVFNQLRSVDGTISGVTHKETAVHADAMWTLPVPGKLNVGVFAGPTFFSVGQDLVSSVAYTETYPFDSATFTGAPTTRGKKSVVGFNAGADVSMFLTERLGVGGLVRFSGATAKIGTPLGGSVSVKAGGLEVGGGIRLRF